MTGAFRATILGCGSSGGVRVRATVSAGCRAIQPSRPGSDPCPDHTTSPVAVSSSSIAGE